MRDNAGSRTKESWKRKDRSRCTSTRLLPTSFSNFSLNWVLSAWIIDWGARACAEQSDTRERQS
jgi:hypothetical protein